MVCAGSGIGPFLGFLKHRSSLGIKTGSVYLLFGCRDKEKDFLHRAELEKFESDGVLTKLIVSFSRDLNNGGIKYVQDLLGVHAADISRLILEEGAYLYVCGDAKNMGKGVHDKLVSVLSETGIDGKDQIKKMTMEGKYKQDLWT